MMQERVLEWLYAHQDELISDLCDLISINSVKTSPEPGKPYGAGAAGALSLSLKKAKRYGFLVKNYDNYVGCVDFNSAPRQLDILAHLDVVPAEPEHWTVTSPFTPVVKDGYVYGRGSADDKGPAVAVLYAMRAIKELGIPLKKNVRLILGCDEESGSTDIEYYYAREPEAPMTFSPDAEYPVINREKGHYTAQISAFWDELHLDKMALLSIDCGTRPNVIPGDAHVRILNMNEDALKDAKLIAKDLGVELYTEQAGEETILHILGKSGHAADPEDANNALTATLKILSALPLMESPAVEAVKALSQIFPHGDYAGAAAGVKMQDDITGALTICLNMLTLDKTGLQAVFDSRFPMCGNQENICAVLRDKCEAFGLQLSDTHMSMPHYVPEDSHFIKTLLCCYEMYKKKPGRCLAIGGGTYVHNLKNGVAFGPVELGTPTNIHGNDENISVEDLILCAAISAQAIIQLCGEDGQEGN